MKIPEGYMGLEGQIVYKDKFTEIRLMDEGLHGACQYLCEWYVGREQGTVTVTDGEIDASQSTPFDVIQKCYNDCEERSRKRDAI